MIGQKWEPAEGTIASCHGYSVSAAGLQDNFSAAGTFPGTQMTIGAPGLGLAMLQEMAERGQLSQDDFDAKRRQILDEI